MNEQEIWAALERIHTTDPRVLYSSDELENLHRRCRMAVEEMSRADVRLSLSRYIRDTMLSEEALARGGGWEDVLSFLDWVDGGME
jgi:hypothetical protein